MIVLLQVYLITVILLLESVYALQPLSDQSESLNQQPKGSRILRKLLNALTITKQLEGNKIIAPIKTVHDQKQQDNKALAKSKSQYKNIRRTDEQELVIENELQSAMSGHKSALNDRPYVEMKGHNDFLVIQDDSHDSFVTVIPNAIYYNIEKKCVNWLDDCSLQGIRARLLHKIRYPYK